MGVPDPLENDPDNPCIGCGPDNPAGLRLTFFRDGDRVRSELTVEPHHQGWPGRMHSAVLYLALVETMNWTLYGLTGTVGLARETGPLHYERRVGVGDRLELVGAVTDPDVPALRVEAVDEAGRRVGWLERTYEVLPEHAFLERMGYDAVPAGLEGCFPG